MPLAELHGVNALRALGDAGADVVLGSPVTSIERSAPGGFSIMAERGRQLVDAVIVATPVRAATTLGAFSDTGGASGLGDSPIVNVHLVLDRRVTDLPMAACVDSPIQFVFDRTASSGAASGQCLSISLSAADAYISVGTATLARSFMDALADVFPAARHAALRDAVVTRERSATFRGVPGTDAMRPGSATSTPGLFLAGAYCDTGWPATMEGAVRSGRDAAGHALRFVSGAALGAVRPLEKAAS